APGAKCGPALGGEQPLNRLTAEGDHLVDLNQSKPAKAKRRMIDEPVRMVDVILECGAQCRQCVFINAEQQRIGFRGRQDLVEKDLECGMRYRVEAKWWFPHFADPMSPDRSVLGAVMRM